MVLSQQRLFITRKWKTFSTNAPYNKMITINRFFFLSEQRLNNNGILKTNRNKITVYIELRYYQYSILTSILPIC